MPAIKKPTQEDLQGLIDDALQNTGAKTLAEWAPTFIASITKHIAVNPKQYRAFGPYWWLVKREMLNAGVTQFGSTTDAEMLERTSFEDPSLGLVAAYAYYDFAIETGLTHSNRHTVFTEDNESEDYLLADEEMEAIAFVSGL